MDFREILVLLLTGVAGVEVVDIDEMRQPRGVRGLLFVYVMVTYGNARLVFQVDLRSASEPHRFSSASFWVSKHEDQVSTATTGAHDFEAEKPSARAHAPRCHS